MALKLSEVDRALLAAVLLESVASEGFEQSADEFERRERELDQSERSEISHEELLRRVKAERRR